MKMRRRKSWLMSCGASELFRNKSSTRFTHEIVNRERWCHMIPEVGPFDLISCSLIWFD